LNTVVSLYPGPAPANRPRPCFAISTAWQDTNHAARFAPDGGSCTVSGPAEASSQTLSRSVRSPTVWNTSITLMKRREMSAAVARSS
jgi:hypothetical protein